jgi:phage gp37-like protein
VIAAGKTEEETEKRLGALLREAVPIVSIDNVNGELGGDALCQMTERPLVRVRILGKSEAPELECRSSVFATGNNMVLLGDMVRRALVCSLDSGLERPELRTYDNDPLTTVLANRGNYVGAALTVLRAYITAGSPRVCGPIGSYAEWSQTVRASLIWLGQPDPVDSMEQAREEDPELCAIRELHMHWQEHLGLLSHHTTSALIKTACEREGFPALSGLGRFAKPDFRELLLRQAGDGSEINSRRLGKWLSRVKGRVVDGYRLVVQADAKHGHRFALVPAE